jgi:hypothetical protein
LEQAGEYDITVKTELRLHAALRYEAPDGSPVDFTGSTAQMQVRAKIGAPTVLFELSTADGSIVLGADGSDGNIQRGTHTDGRGGDPKFGMLIEPVRRK